MSEQCSGEGNTARLVEPTSPTPRRTIRKMPKQSSLGNTSTQSPQGQDSPLLAQALDSSPRQLHRQSLDTRANNEALDEISLADSSASPASPRGKHYFTHNQPRLGIGRVVEQDIAASEQSQIPLISSPILPSYPRSRNSSTSSTIAPRGPEGLGIPDIAFEGQDSERAEFASGARSTSGLHPESEHLSAKKPGKGVFQNLISRSRSTRGEEIPFPRSRPKSKPRTPYLEPDTRPRNIQDSPRTAPLEYERGYRDMMGSSTRNKSADRTIGSIEDDTPSLSSHEAPSSFASRKDSGKLLHNLRNTSTKAAGDVGRAGKGFLAKLTRSGSATERDVHVEEHHVFKVINLPLVQQTQITRITQRMELARDKTEFWMPALPWRCIDYLNLKGVEEEGLYRIPGSGREVKRWQVRFDNEYDVNLLDEPNLYDINIIGSMLKAWLRELPDELFPKAIQKEIEDSCRGASETPQLLRDKLSGLPPYNYYLLFAITCHISVLYMNSEKNKMNYQNLCICFQPCMRIDAFCFGFLVCDWKNCWQGCWTEKIFLEKEFLAQEVDGSSMQTSSAGQSYVDEPMSTSSRPTTGEREHSRDRDAHLMVPQGNRRGSEVGLLGSSYQNRTGFTTPPGVSPVTATSPMRM